MFTEVQTCLSISILIKVPNLKHESLMDVPMGYKFRKPECLSRELEMLQHDRSYDFITYFCCFCTQRPSPPN